MAIYYCYLSQFWVLTKLSQAVLAWNWCHFEDFFCSCPLEDSNVCRQEELGCLRNISLHGLSRLSFQHGSQGSWLLPWKLWPAQAHAPTESQAEVLGLLRTQQKSAESLWVHCKLQKIWIIESIFKKEKLNSTSWWLECQRITDMF